MYDLVVSGRVFIKGSLMEAHVCITDGIIVDIKRTMPGSGNYGKRSNEGNRLILPGAIDLHTHMRDPGLTGKEDFFSGSTSAAFGGITTIVDMPNTIPPTNDERSFIDKKRIALSRSIVDFGLNLVVMDDTDPRSVGNLIHDPAFAGFKVFLGESTGSLVMSDPSKMKSNREIFAGFDKPISVHAEWGPLLKKVQEKKDDICVSHMKARPPEAEARAVTFLQDSMGKSMRLVHLLHISSEMGIAAAAKSSASIEVTPHHLLLDIKNTKDRFEFESMGKVNPPLRRPSDRATLWESVRNGIVDTIGSDHAPHLIEEKGSESPPSGMPGVETMVPLMLNMVKEKRLELERLLELIARNPADRIGLERKGSVDIGRYADLMIVDMGEGRRVRAEDLHSRCGWTPFEGMNGIFPLKVLSRGATIVENGNLCVSRGGGKPMHQNKQYING